MIAAAVISLPCAPYTSISFCGIELLAECHVRPVGYSHHRAFSIASAQRYASVATLLCPTSSASLSGRVAKAVEGWRWLNNAVRAAAANSSRSSSPRSIVVVFTSTV